jgi:hypothetical protein
LLFAADIYKRASKHGLSGNGQWSELNVEKASAGLTEELAGQALFELVAACRKNDIDPESALRRYAASQVSMLE